jgi:hypothetical protein
MKDAVGPRTWTKTQRAVILVFVVLNMLALGALGYTITAQRAWPSVQDVSTDPRGSR